MSGEESLTVHGLIEGHFEYAALTHLFDNSVAVELGLRAIRILLLR